jgi:serine/threonine protein kinase
LIHDYLNSTKDKGRRTEFHVLGTIPLHPNILQVYTYFVDTLDKTKFGTGDNVKSMFVLYDSHPYTLAEWIAKQKSENTLTEKQIRKFLIEILKGLEHLEKYKIVHRDLTLSNILISEDGRAVISGFEKALIFRSRTLTMMYHKKLDVGNTSNLPYEIISVKNPGDTLDYSKVDIWQLGVLCYEMLGLQHPFKNWDKEKYDDNNLPNLPDNISASLNKLIKSMIYFNPSSRPTFAEAIRMLEEKENL